MREEYPVGEQPWEGVPWACAPVLGGPWWGLEGSQFHGTWGAKATVLLLGQPELVALSVHCVRSLAQKLLGEPCLMFSLFPAEKAQSLGILCQWFGK